MASDGTRKEPDWEALERARIARSRAYFRETTPGQRIEDALRLSWELTKLSRRTPSQQR